MTGAERDLSFMTCTCGHNQAFHWAHRGACEACACLFFKLRHKAQEPEVTS